MYNAINYIHVHFALALEKARTIGSKREAVCDQQKILKGGIVDSSLVSDPPYRS